MWPHRILWQMHFLGDKLARTLKSQTGNLQKQRKSLEAKPYAPLHCAAPDTCRVPDMTLFFPDTCTAAGCDIVLDAAITVWLQWEMQSNLWSKQGASSSRQLIRNDLWSLRPEGTVRSSSLTFCTSQAITFHLVMAVLCSISFVLFMCAFL